MADASERMNDRFGDYRPLAFLKDWFAPLAGLDPNTGAQGDLLHQAIIGTPGALHDMAKSSLEASEAMRGGYGYDPKPAFDTSLAMLGAGTAFGPTRAAGEAVLGAGGQQPWRLIHSSPHDFEKFDLSKGFSGEGTQAYLHGVYGAESPAVSGQGGHYWNLLMSRFEGPERQAAMALRANNFDRDAALRSSEFMIRDALENAKRMPHDADFWRARAASEEQVARLLETNKPVGPRTYEFDVKADPEKFLQWDKPIATNDIWQRIDPSVRDAIDEAMDARGMNPMSDVPEAYTGGQLVGALRHWDIQEALPPTLPGSDWYKGTTADKHVTAYLKTLDVPGVRYLDQFSRGRAPVEDISNALKHAKRELIDVQSSQKAGWRTRERQIQDEIRGYERQMEEHKTNPPTYNASIFDDRLIDIRKKYALPLVGAGLGASLMSRENE